MKHKHDLIKRLNSLNIDDLNKLSNYFNVGFTIENGRVVGLYSEVY